MESNITKPQYQPQCCTGTAADGTSATAAGGGNERGISRLAGSAPQVGDNVLECMSLM